MELTAQHHITLSGVLISKLRLDYDYWRHELPEYNTLKEITANKEYFQELDNLCKDLGFWTAKDYTKTILEILGALYQKRIDYEKTIAKI